MKTKFAIGGACAAVIALAAICFSSHLIFKNSTDRELKDISSIKVLEFENGLNSEMALSNQMAHSPLIVEYMQNPDDSRLAELAFREIGQYQESFKSHITFWIGDKDCKYYSNGKYVYTLDKNDPKSAWYGNTLAMNDVDYDLNIDYDIGLKVTNVWVNAIVRNSNKKSIGLIGTGIGLTDFVNSMYKTLNPGYKMVLYNRNMEITGSTNLKYMEDKTPVTDVIPSLKNQAITVSSPKIISNLSGEYMITPITVLGWNILVYREYTLLNFLQFAVYPFIVVLVILLIIVTIDVIRRLLAPLDSLTKTLKDIATGNADLTQRVSLGGRRTTETLNNLVTYVNQFIERMQGMISTIKSSKEELVQYGSKLNSSTTETAGSISEIYNVIKNMNTELESQTTSVSSSSSAMTEISASVDSLENMIKTQAESVSSASASIEEMLHNIDSVNNSVKVLSESFTRLEENTNSGVAKQKDVKEKVEQIRQQSDSLQTANSVIAAIAAQTNLLAMNAAIEAAHAGEAGKGFSVVAEEIRKLSETSSQQSKTIGVQVTTIRDSIGGIVTATADSEKALIEVAGDISSTSQIVKTIESAMENQKQGSINIDSSLSVMNNNMENVKRSSTEMTVGAKAVIKEVYDLEESTQTLKENMGQLNNDASVINQSGSDLSSIASNLENSIKTIEQQIDQFKV